MAMGYAQFKDIDGSATASGFEKWTNIGEIHADAFRDVQQSGFAQVSSSRMTGNTYHKITVLLTLDKAYPKLMKAALGGEPISEVKLALVQTVKGKQEKIAEMELKNVILTECNVEGVDGEPVSKLRVTMMPSEAKHTFTEFDDEKGSKKGDVSATFNVKESKTS